MDELHIDCIEGKLLHVAVPNQNGFPTLKCLRLIADESL
jgi:hypothetical protein